MSVDSQRTSLSNDKAFIAGGVNVSASGYWATSNCFRVSGMEEFELFEREEEFREEVEQVLGWFLKACRALVEMLPVGDGEGKGEVSCCWRCFLFAKNLAFLFSVKLAWSAIIGVNCNYYTVVKVLSYDVVNVWARKVMWPMGWTAGKNCWERWKALFFHCARIGSPLTESFKDTPRPSA